MRACPELDEALSTAGSRTGRRDDWDARFRTGLRPRALSRTPGRSSLPVPDGVGARLADAFVRP